MKKRFVSPLFLVAIVLALLVAGCNRPDTQATLDTPVPAAPQLQPTLPPAIQSTLAPGEMPPDLSVTVVAGGDATPAPQEPLLTPLPALEPTQPSPAANTPAAPAAPAPTAQLVATVQPAAVQSPTGETVYTVQSGDRLFSIARLYNVNPYTIAQLNGIPSPYFIYPGQKLKIPGSSGGGSTPVPPPVGTPVPGGTTYVVRPGDNLFRIALRFGKSMQAIAAANGISNYNFIYTGQVLRIP